MLTQQQKKQLKSLANNLDIKYQIGKNEIGPTVLNMLDKALTAHELIKIDVMKSASDDIEDLSSKLVKELKAELVQTLGHVIILYRRNEKNPKIVLKK